MTQYLHIYTCIYIYVSVVKIHNMSSLFNLDIPKSHIYLLHHFFKFRIQITLEFKFGIKI